MYRVARGAVCERAITPCPNEPRASAGGPFPNPFPNPYRYSNTQLADCQELD